MSDTDSKPEVEETAKAESPKAESPKAEEPKAEEPKKDDAKAGSSKGGLPVWATDPAAEIKLRMQESGPAAMEPKCVMPLFIETAEKFGKRAALKQKVDGAWRVTTWKEYHDKVMTFGRALLSDKVAIEPFQAVSIIGFNSPEWFTAALGTIAAGGLCAGIYTTNGPDAVHYVAEHSQSVVAVVEDQKQLDKFLKIKDRLPLLKAIVMWKGEPEKADDMVYTWAKFMELGADVSESKLKERIDAQKPHHACSLIYTSGTTGNPKSVMITHDNIGYTARLMTKQVVTINENDHIISYLPLSHIAGQLNDIMGPMTCGACVWFAQPDALKGSLGTTLKEVRPTIFMGVPRVWEKLAEALQKIGAQTTGVKKVLSTWAKGKGSAAFNAEVSGSKSKPFMFGVARGVVLDKIKVALGLDRCRLHITAAAPIARETLDYFGSLYLHLLSLYGMSESTGPQTTNLPGFNRPGSVGRAIESMEMKIDSPDEEGNGEICFRGRHIMKGYMRNEEATAGTFDEDGYLHSGDVGKIDKDGYLWITGRIKELIIGAGGENVAPVPIEDSIKAELPLLSNVMVIGDKRKFLSCLVAFKTKLDDEGQPTRDLAPEVLAALGDDIKDTEAARTSDKHKKYVEEGIKRANAKAVSNAQKVQKFEIIADDFSVDGGELTPTLKLKRRIVEKKHADTIEGMYKV